MPDFNDFLRRLHLPGTRQPSEASHDATSTTVEEQAPAGADVTTMFMEALKLEGLQPRIEGDGNIVFKHGRFTLVLLRQEKDPEYLRIVLPNFYSLDSPKMRQRALVAADRVNRKLKVAKVHTGNGDMWACAELFLASQAHAQPVLMRCIEVLGEAVVLFHAMMMEQDD